MDVPCTTIQDGWNKYYNYVHYYIIVVIKIYLQVIEMRFQNKNLTELCMFDFIKARIRYFYSFGFGNSYLDIY